MRHRPLGRTGLEVSEIGFGAWGIGGTTPGATSYGATSDDESRRALERALERGIDFFDTSGVYGAGHSERLIGEVLGARRARVVLATKAGRGDYLSPADFSPDAIRRSLDASTARLRTDWVDLLQLHNPPVKQMRPDDPALETMRSLQREGRIRAFGISVADPIEARIAIEELGAPVLQLNLNLLDQRPFDDGVLDLAARHGCGIIARTPLCFGVLTGAVDEATRFAPDDHRSVWPREQIDRWVEASRSFVARVARRDVQTPAQIALRFCLSSPAVAATIPGMLTCEQVDENASASDLGPLPSGDFDALRELYASRRDSLAPVRGRRTAAGALAR
jgi:aryl-alcohol dehydrogenase-like predicted oxidoreductase